MALVAYSDSEGSESEEEPKAIVRAAPKSSQSQTPAGFAVNKSNPRKIQVSLTDLAATTENRTEDGEPMPKRVRRGGGGLEGFNSMLPAPKRVNEKKPTSNEATRKVFSLKTGAEPGFSREADAELMQLLAEKSPTAQQNGSSISHAGSSAKSEPVKTGNPMRFKPLSVARNTNNRKLTSSAPAKKAVAPVNLKVLDEPASADATVATLKSTKVNLFSAGLDDSAVSFTPIYENLELERDTARQPEDKNSSFDTPNENNHGDILPITSSNAQSLDTIASDLNLSNADRRRLFGREWNGTSSAISIVNFNTDQEYAANEALRASGEQIQHNPIRGIAPGKHSLKQLVNAASTQKDALEESFAAGKSNKREAGSRYGW